MFLVITLALSVAVSCVPYTQGTVHRMDRSFIVVALDDVVMKAFYKGIDVLTVPINVSWYKQEELLSIGGRFQLSENNTVLTIAETELQDKGTYKSVLAATNASKFITEFTLVVRKRSIPQWAVALIIVGLVFLLAATIIFFKCRQEISAIVIKRIPRRKKRTYTAETSFQE